jgi:hypothetical protein
MTERTGVLTANPLSREPLARRLGRPRDTRSRLGKTSSSPMATIQDGCDRRNREAGKLERMALHGAGQAVASARPRRARARGHGVSTRRSTRNGARRWTAGAGAGNYVHPTTARTTAGEWVPDLTGGLRHPPARHSCDGPTCMSRTSRRRSASTSWPAGGPQTHDARHVWALGPDRMSPHGPPLLLCSRLVGTRWGLSGLTRGRIAGQPANCDQMS